MLRGATEKRARARGHENVQHRFVEGGIGGVAVRLPILVGEIELDAAAQNFSAIDPDCGVGKIGAGFAIPGAELHDLDLFARRAGERPPEIAREPARLQLQLGEIARLRKERALANFRRGEKLCVTLGTGHLLQARARPLLIARRKARSDLHCITNCTGISRGLKRRPAPVEVARAVRPARTTTESKNEIAIPLITAACIAALSPLGAGNRAGQG